MNTKRPCKYCGKKTHWHRFWVMDEGESKTACTNPVNASLNLVQDHFKIHGFICNACEKKINAVLGKALAEIISLEIPK